ncbi:MAG: hypothetical protein HY319_06740 [Armatimonadetes bacterium]|nr:hypothetical protein [Armatimonadota bacterium]
MAIVSQNIAGQADLFATQHALNQRGTLYDGVRSGQLNQKEFVALASRLNQTVEGAASARARSELSRATQPSGLTGLVGAIGGAVSQQATDMEAAQQTYGRIKEYSELQREFLQGDQHPDTELRDGVDGRLHEQLIQLYNGIRNGSISREEAAAQLGEYVQVSRLRAEQGADGVVTAREQANVDGRLDASAAHLEERRTNG